MNVWKILFFVCCMSSIINAFDHRRGTSLIDAPWWNEEIENCMTVQTQKDIQSLNYQVLSTNFMKHYPNIVSEQERWYVRHWATLDAAQRRFQPHEMHAFLQELAHPVYDPARIIRVTAWCCNDILQKYYCFHSFAQKMAIHIPVQPYHAITFNHIDWTRRFLITSFLKR